MGVKSELNIFITAVIGGAVIAFIYDLFRLKRKAVKTNPVFIYIEDIIFWIISALIIFTALYISNEGQVRLYFFFGAIIGVSIYETVFSKTVMKLIMLLSKLILSPLFFFIKLIKKPVKYLFKKLEGNKKKIKSVCSYILWKIKINFRFIRKNFKKI